MALEFCVIFRKAFFTVKIFLIPCFLLVLHDFAFEVYILFPSGIFLFGGCNMYSIYLTLCFSKW